jgi:tryptophan synthase beta chain
LKRPVTTPDCKYVLVQYSYQVLYTSRVSALKQKRAWILLGEYPDIVIGCEGGGSNLVGLIAPYMPYKLAGAANTDISRWSPPPVRP